MAVMMHREPVQRLRAPLVADPYAKVGNAAVTTRPDWGNAAVMWFEAAVSDAGSTEPLIDARTAVDTDFTLYADSGIDVLPTDRLVVRGKVCDVQGYPFDWRSPFTGWAPGSVIRASIREG